MNRAHMVGAAEAKSQNNPMCWVSRIHVQNSKPAHVLLTEFMIDLAPHLQRHNICIIFA